MEKEEFTFHAGESDRGERLDKFLTAKFREKFSRSFLQKLINEGNVLVNGSPAKSHHKIRGGESIKIIIPKPTQPSIEAEEIPLDIVYEDEHLMVINKPQGMVVHPAPGNYTGTLVNALLWYCRDLSGIGGYMKPGIVHRLDKGTSGLLVVAKTDLAHRGLANQFKQKTVKKVYVALVKGVVQTDNGIIELPIGRSPMDRKKMAVRFDKSKDALTRYRVLERFKDATLVEVILATGRTHQIRVHMAHIGHPVLGDAKYGGKYGVERPALHAKTLGFIHPGTKKHVEFTSKLPDDMLELIKKIDKDNAA